MFDVTISKLESGRCVASLRGRLDTTSAPMCEKKIMPELRSPGLQVMVFDMENLEFISSMGLRLIFKVRKELEALKKTFIMVKLQPQIAKVFDIAAALPREAIFASLEEADRYFAVMQQKVMNKNR